MTSEPTNVAEPVAGRAPARPERSPAKTVGGRAGSLEAPHRRVAGGPRPLEKATVLAYRSASWAVGRLPARPSWLVASWFTRLGYLLWPKKRHWVDQNFGHVLGVDPRDKAVRAMALRAYRNYARYLVELMRLPSLAPEVIGQLVEPEGIASLEGIWRESNGLILAVGHVGNNEACAAGVAWRGWPISVVADDSTFPEMFELFRRQREGWGVRVIPWRNLREVYSVLRRREMLALLVDWGYREDGIPVRMFGAWTTLPAGPAALAAKTGASILPITIRRQANGTFYVTHDAPIRVASSHPAELGRATQAMADALQRTIAAAPDQWYSFKPIWPETAAEGEGLARRAADAMAAEAADAIAAEAGQRPAPTAAPEVEPGSAH